MGGRIRELGGLRKGTAEGGCDVGGSGCRGVRGGQAQAHGAEQRQHVRVRAGTGRHERTPERESTPTGQPYLPRATLCPQEFRSGTEIKTPGSA
ncbi:hypothetical protein GCM10010435_92030 [Winogradskya consettensis]|uniref:Uncharacterized protein n=1 Tax=Winogradskya consettensis TaxID=113560 RepID=A0A919VZ83_9ACTN|nr:hypothetical protein Aco04nite_76130 [Actinoplanes consettensis]